MIVSRSPGKLYFAGEYAVLEKGHPAIIFAINQFIEVSLIKTEDIGSIQTYDSSPIPFIRTGQKIHVNDQNKQLSYLINTIKTVEKLALELNKDLKFYHLKIDSDLETVDGRKYGLGSSSGVTVSTIKALCQFYNIKLNPLQVFKLAAIVHTNMNSNGSGGDLAAAIYQGFILYRSFDKNWLKDKLNTYSIKDIINENWPFLEIEKLQKPKDLQILVGWTGKPASTNTLVNKIHLARKCQEKYYTQFLNESRKSVEKIITAFKSQDNLEILKQINISRKLLKDLGKQFNVEIETFKLEKLSEIANKYGGAAKTSGAGGGDCGIAVFNKKINKENLIQSWNQHGIMYLPLKVYEENNHE